MLPDLSTSNVWPAWPHEVFDRCAVAEKALCLVARSGTRRDAHAGSTAGQPNPDTTILDIAEREFRIIVTKDDDFVQSHLISGRPEKLLLVATGNIGNAELEILLRKNLASIIQALDGGKFVEIDREALTIHA